MNADALTTAAALAGIAACLGDVVIPTILGRLYPGYDGTREVLSRLGCADSPVRLWINGWWCLFGALMGFFAWGFFRAFGDGAILSWPALAALLLLLFGLGAGPGAGLFPMDVPGTAATRSGWLHSTLSGAGFLAIALFPAVCLAVFGGGKSTLLFWWSLVALLDGIALAALVGMSGKPGATGMLALGGLWQRVFVASYYLHLTAIAVVMLRCKPVS